MTRFPVLRSAAFILLAAALKAQSPTINDLPSREFGQPTLVAPIVSSAPNLVEGREFFSPSELAFDVFSGILYVSDTGNNRVLAWKNPQGLSRGNPADLVIGQLDKTSTFAHGPGTSQANGFNTPASVAVDNVGSLYVLDARNHRILRFPSPFSQAGGFLQWDLVIGQKSISSSASPNEGAATSAVTLNLTYGGSMAFDSQFNLWVADSGNNRVLRFPNSALIANSIEPKADIVLGQANSNCVGPDPFACNNGANQASDLTAMNRPGNLSFDAQGNLYVSDGLNRVLYYQGPFTTASTFGKATRILGIPPTPAAGQKSAPLPNNYSLSSPGGIFTDGTNIYVCDSGNNRIVRYGPPASWAAATTAAPSPAALSAIGQADLNSGKPNKGQVAPDATTLNSPQKAIFPFGGSGDLWVVDGGNNRVISLPPNGAGSYGAATRVLGQVDFSYSAVNLIEGREVWLANNAAGGALVIDKTSNPPHLYVSDTYNHRILGFRDVRTVGTDAKTVLTQKADLVIGQPDLFTAIPNYPNGNLGTTPTPNATGLNLPGGLALDGAGSLYVADTGNGRVLRFPTPFNQPNTSALQANLVLGQNTFTTPGGTGVTGPSNMGQPYGLAFLSDGSLAVSDRQFNRVLLFRRSNGADFSNYQAATVVIGQSNFNDSTSVQLSTANYGLHSPAHLAVDTSDRLYVADTSNGRVAIFTQVLTAAPGGFFAAAVTGLNSPLGISVSPVTGEMWVADTGNNLLKRFKEFTQFQFDQSPSAQLNSVNPLAVALDPFGNLIVAEASNRISFYYPKLTYQHAATYNQRPLAPGQLAYLYRLGADFAFAPADGTQISPWPTSLGDIQVSVNGTVAPVFRVNPTRIDFQIPQSAPTSGTASFVVTQVSTGAILGAATIQMAPTNPGFFTANAQGTGQVAAFNQDGSVNSPTNAIPRGQVISFCLTGAGPIPGGPADGAPPSAAASTPTPPVLLSSAFTGGIVPPQFVQYSGVGCGFAGGWQVNFQVPTTVPPGPNNAVALIYEDIPSNAGPTNQPLVVLFSAK